MLLGQFLRAIWLHVDLDIIRWCWEFVKRREWINYRQPRLFRHYCRTDKVKRFYKKKKKSCYLGTNL